jgi:N-acyl-D-aspartate/D-glutamate deacylase
MEELRAHAHGERHRIHVELHHVANQVSSGVEPEDLHEPGAAWKPLHHRDAEVAKTKLAKQSRRTRHWKTKMWKRRTSIRQARAEAMRLAGES